ncbi:hypothetical protein KVT40_007788 [Elsinoe batatas]|uniref:RING-type domain-containing protein n=1 Tax=Elsinoe batatas TaxID=2601811 RepID=A0A8K0PCL7_9PEZI|nr:hypothetical protein KVT40_007788 [Elsinoe batatas]
METKSLYDYASQRGQDIYPTFTTSSTIMSDCMPLRWKVPHPHEQAQLSPRNQSRCSRKPIPSSHTGMHAHQTPPNPIPLAPSRCPISPDVWVPSVIDHGNTANRRSSASEGSDNTSTYSVYDGDFDPSVSPLPQDFPVPAATQSFLGQTAHLNSLWRQGTNFDCFIREDLPEFDWESRSSCPSLVEDYSDLASCSSSSSIATFDSRLPTIDNDSLNPTDSSYITIDLPYWRIPFDFPLDPANHAFMRDPAPILLHTHAHPYADARDTSSTEPPGLDVDFTRPKPQTDEEMTMKLDCKICFTQTADTACMPCGHLVMCRWCSAQHGDRGRHLGHTSLQIGQGSLCPLCRELVDENVRVRVV